MTCLGQSVPGFDDGADGLQLFPATVSFQLPDNTNEYGASAGSTCYVDTSQEGNNVCASLYPLQCSYGGAESDCTGKKEGDNCHDSDGT